MLVSVQILLIEWTSGLPFKVQSLDPVTSNLESAENSHLYTGAT